MLGPLPASVPYGATYALFGVAIAGFWSAYMVPAPFGGPKPPYCEASPVSAAGPPAEAEAGGLKLTQVQALVRHGARSPLGIIPGQTNPHVYSCELDPEVRELAEGWPARFAVVNASSGRVLDAQPSILPETLGDDGALCSPGELTNLGFRQHLLHGRRLREAYAGHAHGPLANLSAGDLYARSTPTGRTLGSAIALLSGLLGPEPGPAPQAGKFKIEVYEDMASEPLVGGKCDRVDTGQAFMRELTQIEPVLMAVCHGVELPCTTLWCMTSDRVPEEVDRGHQVVCDKFKNGREESRLKMEPLMREVAGRMNDMHGGREGAVRFALYSGHDLSMINVAAALGFFDCQWPPLASHIIFELWTSAGSSAVRVLFNGKPVTADIAGCGGGGLCPLDDFARVVRGMLGNYSSYADACSPGSAP